MDSDTRLAADDGTRDASSPEVNIIPTGWHLVKTGPLCAGDKYWDSELLAWAVVTVNSHYMAEYFSAVIRRGDA